MSDPSSVINLAVFCDFENVALGVRDARYDAFDIQLVLARVLDKGKVVVKKAYADWDRYKAAKRPMHEAAFELIERVRQVAVTDRREGLVPFEMEVSTIVVRGAGGTYGVYDIGENRHENHILRRTTVPNPR